MHTAPHPSQRVFHLTRGWTLFFIISPLCLWGLYTLLPILTISVIFIVTGQATSAYIIPIILILLAFLAFFCIIGYSSLYFVFKRIGHIVSSAGIEFRTLGSHIYSPWHNIVKIERRPLGAYYNPPSLILREPAILGNIEDGKRQGIATANISWYASKNKKSRESIPLIFTVPKADWRACELGVAIRHYAPQALDPELDCPPDQQTLHRTIKKKLRILNITLILSLVLLLILLGSTILITAFILKDLLMVDTIYAMLLAWLWLLSTCIFIYLWCKQLSRTSPPWYKNRITFGPLIGLLMFSLSILNLTHLYTWLNNPISSFINEEVGTIRLLFTSIGMLWPAVHSTLASRVIAREAKLLETLRTPQP